MFKIGEIKMSELAGTAFPELAGREGLLYGVSDPEAPESNSMIYVRTEVADSYTKVRDSIFVTKEEVELPGLHESCVQLKASMQKSLYGVLLETYKKLLPKAELVQKNGSYISSDVKIGTDVEIAPFCVDVYRLEDGVCRDLPHLAGTVIEDGCLLLAGSILAAGDSRTTVLGKSSVIGMLGDVGHNCVIKEFSSVGGKSSISGHCDLGEHVYIAPMAVTTNRISVGDHAYLGIGAVAIKDVPEGEKQFGNPARKVLELKKK